MAYHSSEKGGEMEPQNAKCKSHIANWKKENPKLPG
jgi:hypothetical protein